MSGVAHAQPYSSNFEHLEDELRWLDVLLRLRARTFDLLNRADPECQASRAVYIAPAEVEWLLDYHRVEDAVEDTAAALHTEAARLRTEIDNRLARSAETTVFLAIPQLARLFGLSDFECAAIVICLAPELRRKYDRVYAYLQDDITRKRPSIDLVLNLLCDGEHTRWHANRLFSDHSTLLRAALLCKTEDPHSPSGSSNLAQLLKLDPRVCEFLLGGNQIDSCLTGVARLQQPTATGEQVPVDPAITGGVWSLIKHHLATPRSERRKLVLHLHGPSGVGKRELALYVCRRLNDCLLSVDVEMLLTRGAESESLLRLAFREGLLQKACLLMEHADALQQESARPLLKALQVAISEYGWLVFLSGRAPWASQEAFAGCLFCSADLPLPDVPIRAAVWERCLDGHTSEAAAWAARLAAQFRLTPGQIRSAVEMARNRNLLNLEPHDIIAADLATACREQSNQKLRQLAVKVDPHYEWDDIVLPEDKLLHLHEICNHVRHQYRVFGSWGFGKKVRHGRGLSALFTGPSGTGKTMAAEVVAHELGLDLYKIDLSGVVSKYIGETEKNLARIFSEAETSNAILFFDEADALFGKRTEVSDAHDRYANIETSYLLQKMEAYEGMVILATNLRENMDEAFTRRIRFIVEFPFPDEANRLRIWQSHFPVNAPISPDIDYGYLARELPIQGGSIKNIVLSAAFSAARDDTMITMKHILQGAKREFEKVGKFWHERHPVPVTSIQELPDGKFR